MQYPKNQIPVLTALLLTLFWGASFACMAKEGSYDTIMEYEHVELSSQISVAGHRLCQDGQFIYFNSKPDCVTNNHFLNDNGMPRFNCDSNLQLAPISELELIHTKKGLTLQRFYNISLSYQVRKKIRIPGTHPVQYKTLTEENRKIPQCAGRPFRSTPPLLQERQVYSLRENFLIRELLDNGIYAINKSRGQVSSVNHLQHLTPLSVFQPQTLQKLAVPDEDALEITSQEVFQLKTPYCSGKNSNEISSLLGGWGGGGSRAHQAASELETLSKPLQILDLMTPDTWKQIEKGEIAIEEKSLFSIQCL